MRRVEKYSTCTLQTDVRTSPAPQSYDQGNSASATGSGLLPTPTTVDTGARFNRSQSAGAKLRPTLGAMARHNLFPMPTTQDAANNGGPSRRDRIFYSTPTCGGLDGGSNVRKSSKSRGTHPSQFGGLLNPDWVEWLMGWPIGWTDLDNDDPNVHGWKSEPPDVPRVTDKRTRRAQRLKALGNGQVPQCAALAWQILTETPC